MAGRVLNLCVKYQDFQERKKKREGVHTLKCQEWRWEDQEAEEMPEGSLALGQAGWAWSRDRSGGRKDNQLGKGYTSISFSVEQYFISISHQLVSRKNTSDSSLEIITQENLMKLVIILGLSFHPSFRYLKGRQPNENRIPSLLWILSQVHCPTPSHFYRIYSERSLHIMTLFVRTSV